jgi:hypothetical protein
MMVFPSVKKNMKEGNLPISMQLINAGEKNLLLVRMGNLLFETADCEITQKNKQTLLAEWLLYN